MALEVTFCVDVRNDGCVEEKELEARLDDLRPRILADDYIEGAVTIRPNPDSAEVRVEDMMEALVLNLCFGAIGGILAREHVVVSYFNMYGYLRMDPEADLELISGDYVPTVRVPYYDLAEALYGCGVRFVDFYRRLTGGDPYYEENLKAMEEKAQEAARILADNAGERERWPGER
jgi:hypothetical protein